MASLDAQLADINRAADQLIGEAGIMLVLEVTDLLVDATPVDTGNAKAGWVPGVGEPAVNPGQGAAAQAAGTAAVAGYTVALGLLNVSNVVPYVGRLNEGSSTQAPAKFVEACVEHGVANTQDKLEARSRGRA